MTPRLSASCSRAYQEWFGTELLEKIADGSLKYHDDSEVIFRAGWDAAEQQANQYRQWLLEYGRHGYGCNAEYGDKYRCRCGWRDVEAELKAEA